MTSIKLFSANAACRIATEDYRELIAEADLCIRLAESGLLELEESDFQVDPDTLALTVGGVHPREWLDSAA